MEKFREKLYYREKIIEMVRGIENAERLIKILTVAKTHYEIEKEKGEV